VFLSNCDHSILLLYFVYGFSTIFQTEPSLTGPGRLDSLTRVYRVPSPQYYPPSDDKTPKQERVNHNDEDDDDEDDNFVQDGARAYGRENFASVASPYPMPYVYKRRSLHTQYGVLNDGDKFTIGDSPIVVETGGDITIKERVSKESKRLWEMLTRTKMNTEFMTKDNLKKYKKILTMSNAHLTKISQTVT